MHPQLYSKSSRLLFTEILSCHLHVILREHVSVYELLQYRSMLVTYIDEATYAFIARDDWCISVGHTHSA